MDKLCFCMAGTAPYFVSLLSHSVPQNQKPEDSEQGYQEGLLPLLKASGLGWEAGLELSCTYPGLQRVPVEFPVAPVPAGQVYFNLSQETVTSQWVIVPNREV